jgi:cytochrome c553
LASAEGRSAKNRLSSLATLTTKFKTASRSIVSEITVCREFHEMGFNGQTAAHKPKIAMNLEHWKRVLWRGESSFTMW